MLIDTQLLIWSAFTPARLPPRARALIQERAQPIAFSMVSLWEVAIKTSMDRPDFVVEPRRLHDGLVGAGFLELPITAGHLVRVATLPWVQRDPFERLLVAQAIEEKIILLTADRTLAGYGRSVRVV